MRKDPLIFEYFLMVIFVLVFFKARAFNSEFRCNEYTVWPHINFVIGTGMTEIFRKNAYSLNY